LGAVFVLRIGLSILITSQISFSLAPSLGFILLSALGIGVSGGLIEGGVSTLIASTFGKSAASPMNTSQVFYGLGAIIGPLIIGITRGWGIFWPMSFIGIAVMTLLLIWAFSHRCCDKKVVSSKVNERLSPLKKDEFTLIIIISLIMMCYVGVEISLAAWLSIFGEQSIGMKKRNAPLLLSAFWLGITFGRVLSSRLRNPFHYALMVGLMAAAGGIQIMTLSLVDKSINALILSFGIGFVFGGIWPITIALAAINFERKKELAIGFFIAIGALGGAVMPGIFGFIAERLTLSIAINVMGSIMFIVSLLSWPFGLMSSRRCLKT